MGRKILLVDPDPSFLRKLGARLRKAEFEVETASDGARALESALIAKPDLVVTNYNLPIFDGERLRAFLRTNPTTFHIPFIFLIDAGREKEAVLASVGDDAWLVKPFRWEDIAERIDGSFVPRQPPGEAVRTLGTGVEGNLREVSLVDLIQIFSLNRRTGVLEVRREALQGMVYLKEGEVVNAALAEAKGEKALFRMLHWKEGTFRFLPEKFTISRNILRTTDSLLMEGLRQTDEWQALKDRLPPPETRLVLTRDPGDLPRDLRPITQEVILLLEFFSTLGEIIEKCSYTDYEISRTILGLMQKGIIAVGAPSEAGELRRKHPLVTPDQALRIRELLGGIKESPFEPVMGKILFFSPTPQIAKEFLSRAGELPEFRLSRDNFSNQEILASSFGALGTLEISENTALQIFLLPGQEEGRPLWRPFSFGAAGAMVLRREGAGENGTEQAIRGFVSEELGLPTLTLDFTGEGTIREAPGRAFHLLFELLLKTIGERTEE